MHLATCRFDDVILQLVILCILHACVFPHFVILVMLLSFHLVCGFGWLLLSACSGGGGGSGRGLGFCHVPFGLAHNRITWCYFMAVF